MERIFHQLKVPEENNKINKARELLLRGDIEADDIRLMYADPIKDKTTFSHPLLIRV